MKLKKINRNQGDQKIGFFGEKVAQTVAKKYQNIYIETTLETL